MKIDTQHYIFSDFLSLSLSLVSILRLSNRRRIYHTWALHPKSIPDLFQLHVVF